MRLNGEDRDVPSGVTVRGLLEHLELQPDAEHRLAGLVVKLTADPAALLFFHLPHVLPEQTDLLFAGDVAAYVSPYKVSKFEEIRRAIQDRGKRVARFVYSAEGETPGQALYDKVFVVGHSLGSVLAYDTLNDAINRDIHQHGWSAGSHC